MQALTISLHVCIYRQTQKRSAVYSSVDSKDMHHNLTEYGISPNIYLLILTKYLVVLKQLKSMLKL